MTSFTVADDDGVGERLDLWLARRLAKVSRSRVQKWIESGLVSLNGREARARDLLAAGDVVTVATAPPEPSPLTPVAMPLDILYEDDQLIVLNKPAGLTVHPGAGDTGPTLVQGLLHHVGRQGLSGGGASADPLAAQRPGIVHRLDKDTTGVLVCAKTEEAHAALAQQFHDKTQMVREYQALLDGVLDRDEVVRESWLARDPTSRLRMASVEPERTGARYARSWFRREAVYGERLTLVRVRLYTGRTHQIRVHAKDLGLPVVGDLVYHRPTELPKIFEPALRALVRGLSRQMLHARVLGFKHPLSGQSMTFEAPLPADFSKVLADLAPYSQSPILPISQERGR